MNKCHSFFTALLVLFSLACAAQVKSNYLYNPSMSYGTLDIRTTISASDYYYLQQNETFSYRTSAGVRTNTFHDMTPWDSSPYREGNLRRKTGSNDKFVMNYRLLFPENYDENYAQGYPLILLLHGAKERGNCYYNQCFHDDFDYDPNINEPAAPTDADHPLLNNDYHLIVGGTQHLNARNLAGGKLPDDPSLAARAFPGFVLMPQMLNIWDSLNVEDAIRIVQLVSKTYNIDQDRIYVEGLSIGGYAVYETLKRASWLFAAATPMSAVSEAANIFKHNQQAKVAHIPIWAFQGGKDTGPTPAFTENLLKRFRDQGALTRYTVYPNAGHVVWGNVFSESDFFRWLLDKSKRKIHVAFGMTDIDRNANKFPRLELAEGFLAYQWQKDGTTLANALGNSLIVKEPGVYRARFSRVSSSPSENEWNRWSNPVTITGDASGSEEEPGEDPSEEDPGEDDGNEQPDDDSGEEDPSEENPDDDNEQPGEDSEGEEPSEEDPGEDDGNQQPDDDSGEEDPSEENPDDDNEQPGEDSEGEEPSEEDPGEDDGNQQPDDDSGEEEPSEENPDDDNEQPDEDAEGEDPSEEDPGEDEGNEIPDDNSGEEEPSEENPDDDNEQPGEDSEGEEPSEEDPGEDDGNQQPDDDSGEEDPSEENPDDDNEQPGEEPSEEDPADNGEQPDDDTEGEDPLGEEPDEDEDGDEQTDNDTDGEEPTEENPDEDEVTEQPDEEMPQDSIITSIPSAASEEIVVYPNPAKDEIHILLTEDFHGTATITIIDQIGRPVFTQQLSTQGTTQTTMHFELPNGLYLLVIEVNDQREYKRLMIRH